MKKILIVDDDPSLLALIKSLLRSEYDVVTLPNGEEAIDSLSKIKPDLILTDVMMAKMSGYEFFVNVKNRNASFPPIPIVVMSARENLKHIFEAGEIAAFLPKPFTSEELKQTLEKIFSA